MHAQHRDDVVLERLAEGFQDGPGKSRHRLRKRTPVRGDLAGAGTILPPTIAGDDAAWVR
ncbi:MAG: hypothetical protein R3B49_02540 [Phycisphaerales bacterium]